MKEDTEVAISHKTRLYSKPYEEYETDKITTDH